jgi:acyl-coenzyme A synthetase/AMP-(fatty) acid ligase
MWDLGKYKNNLAVISETGQEYTYGELQEATEVLNKNIIKRSLIFTLCRNCYEAVLGYVAFINGKHVQLLLDATIDIEFLKKLIHIYKPDYFWIPVEARNTFLHWSVVSTGKEYLLLKTQFNHHYQLSRELALLIPTSGTTGAQKLVKISFQNIKANTDSIVKYLGMTEQDCAITNLPMHYTYGLSVINTHLYCGAQTVITEKSIVQKEFWNQFKTHRVTSLNGVPYTYEMLRRLNLYKMELPDLKYLTQAGGKLSESLHQQLADYAIKTGKKLFVMYGQTEATSRISYLPAQMADKKIGSVGIAIPGGKLSLRDPNGRTILIPDTPGELIYEGPNVALGYASVGDDLNMGDDNHLSLSTGDIATRDSDGYYYICGRKNRYAKIYGNRINLDEVENLLTSVYSDSEFACIENIGKLWIIATEPALCVEIGKFITEKLNINSAAIKVQQLSELPKSSAGKIKYLEIAEIITAQLNSHN